MWVVDRDGSFLDAVFDCMLADVYVVIMVFDQVLCHCFLPIVEFVCVWCVCLYSQNGFCPKRTFLAIDG